MFNTNYLNVKSLLVIGLFAVLAFWIFKHFSSKGE